MYIFLSILIVIACVLLIGVVLIQKSKGGGLASDYSSGNQFLGYRKTGCRLNSHMESGNIHLHNQHFRFICNPWQPLQPLRYCSLSSTADSSSRSY